MNTTTEKNPNIEGQQSLIHQFIIDQSGSMSNSRDHIIDLFNKLAKKIETEATIASVAHANSQHLISLCVFDGHAIEHWRFIRSLDKISPLTRADYKPKANTPLFDAIGAVIQMQDAY